MSWKSSTYRWDTLYIETIKMQMGTNSQDVETFKNKLCEHLMIFYFDIWNTKSLFFCCHDGCDIGCQVFTKGIQIVWPKIIIIKGILTHFYVFDLMCWHAVAFARTRSFYSIFLRHYLLLGCTLQLLLHTMLCKIRTSNTAQRVELEPKINP